MPTLDEFESRLQSLLEVHLIKYLPGYKVEDGVAQQLASAMQRHLKEEAGITYAPNLYIIMAHPSTLTRWHAKPRLRKELAGALYIAGKEAGFQFSSMPAVSTNADPSMAIDTVRIMVSFTTDNVGETLGVQPGETSESEHGTIPSNAFLIVGGTQVIPLNRSVFNIGRRLDNHIVIDDPRVSRAHAQLRIIKDRFVLFDLNSSGGTFVNGQRAHQSILYPGDVINLAGVSLIFGQDIPNWRSHTDGHTTPGSTLSGERPTAILGKEDDGNDR